MFSHATELELIGQGPVLGSPEMTVFIAGIVEVVAGLVVLILWKSRWPIYLSLLGFSVLLVGALVPWTCNTRLQSDYDNRRGDYVLLNPVG